MQMRPRALLPASPNSKRKAGVHIPLLEILPGGSDVESQDHDSTPADQHGRLFKRIDAVFKPPSLRAELSRRRFSIYCSVAL